MILLGQATDRTAFKDSLIHACVCNLAYDPQCEHERSAYLARLVAASGSQDAVFATLASRLGAPADDGIDVAQLFGVLARLAEGRTDLEKSTVRQSFWAMPPDNQLYCIEALVRLDGLPALLQCVELLSARLPEEPWHAVGLLDALDEHYGSPSGPRLLLASAEHPQLGILLPYLMDDEQPGVRRTDESYDFAEIRSGLLNGTRPSGGWLAKLTDAEWRALADDLELQTDEKRAIPYLRLFSRRRFPEKPQQLLRWARSSNWRVSWPATMAMGRMKEAFVREFALERLRDGDTNGVRLLRSNYEPGDLAMIEPLLSEALEDERTHDLGLSVLDIIGENDIPPEESRAVLVLIYERTPCSMCRGSAVEKLVEAGQAPSWIAEECRFDADPDTIQLFSVEC